MKAILVIDIPKTCEDCCLYYQWANKCKGNEKAVVDNKKKLIDCPLKPMPRKRGKVVLTERTQDINHIKWQLECNIFSEGYNKCIDELLGEEE